MVRNDQVIIYLDNVTVATNYLDEHFSILEEVLRRLVVSRFELKLDKCVVLQSEVKYLGYKVNADGIRADDTGFKAEKNFPVSDRLRSVQSVLRLCSYCRRFIRNSLFLQSHYTV